VSAANATAAVAATVAAVAADAKRRKSATLRVPIRVKKRLLKSRKVPQPMRSHGNRGRRVNPMRHGASEASVSSVNAKSARKP
jgi:hypothetical protein